MRVWDMQSRVTLRWLIVLDILASFLGPLLALGGFRLEILFTDQLHNPVSWQHGVVLILFMVTNWLGRAGMWFLKSWARWLYVASWGLSMAVMAMSGGSSFTALGRVIECLPGLTGGFLLCHVFTGEGAVLFHVKRLADGLSTSSNDNGKTVCF